jgi:hypothetical protein
MGAKKGSPAKRKSAVKQKPKDAAPAPETAPKIDRRMRKTVVAAIRRQVERKLEKEIEKASLADYIRLVQLEKELQQTEAKERNATWVEPKAAEEPGPGK